MPGSSTVTRVSLPLTWREIGLVAIAQLNAKTGTIVYLFLPIRDVWEMIFANIRRGKEAVRGRGFAA